jgi:hypothetical protein
MLPVMHTDVYQTNFNFYFVSPVIMKDDKLLG